SYDLITLSMRKLLEKHGIKKDDLRASAMTGSGPRVECMRSGECAAAVVTPPFDRVLEQEGYHTLGSSHEIDPLLFVAEIVNRPWAQANQDTLVRYIRGSAAAMRYINDPNNANEVRPIIREITKSSDAVAGEVLTRYYYSATHPYLPRQAELDVASFGRV